MSQLSDTSQNVVPTFSAFSMTEWTTAFVYRRTWAALWAGKAEKLVAILQSAVS